jgi:hypothetical protein
MRLLGAFDRPSSWLRQDFGDHFLGSLGSRSFVGLPGFHLTALQLNG